MRCPTSLRKPPHAPDSPCASFAAVSIAIKTFISTFFNAYVVTLLVDSDIVSLSRFPLIFKGPYADFTPEWYAAVCSALAITCFSQAIQPPILAALTGGLSRAMVARGIKKQYTQRDLNVLLSGSEWQLGTRVAQTLNAVWLVFGLLKRGGFLKIASDTKNAPNQGVNDHRN